MEIAAVLVPCPEGEKVTVKVVVEKPLIDAEVALSVIVKSAAFVPLFAISEGVPVRFNAAAPLFCMVNVIAVAQTWMISMGLTMYAFPYWGIMRFATEIAHAVGVIVPVFTSYLGHKHFSFRAS